MDIIYICDKKRECNKSSVCGTFCNHTYFPEHAKNGTCKVPTLSPRFRRKVRYSYEEEERESGTQTYIETQ